MPPSVSVVLLCRHIGAYCHRSCFLLAAVALLGCAAPAPNSAQPLPPARVESSPTPPPRGKQATPIEALSQTEQLVVVAGQIERHVPLVDAHLYQLADKTGRVWVKISNSLQTSAPTAPLAAGTPLTAEGTLRYRQIDIDGANLSEVYIDVERYALNAMP